MALGNAIGIGIPTVNLGLGGGSEPVEERFVISVKTDNAGTSADNQFRLPWTGTYDVDWGDGNTDTGVVNTQTHTYASAGTYDVKVTAVSGRIYFDNGGDKAKLLNIKNWGTCEWTSMDRAFFGCNNLSQLSCTDTPDLSLCTTTSRMFRDCSDFTGYPGIGEWDVSNVTNMTGMFFGTSFNQPIGNWDVSSVTNMSTRYDGLFNGTPFNQPIGDWDVSSVTNMGNMFDSSSFNQDISSWDVSNVSNMEEMFRNASAFNQPIGNWNVSNVTDMREIFKSCLNFNQDLNSWDVSNVVEFGWFLGGAFENCQSFNFEYIKDWDVSSATKVARMLAGNKTGYFPLENWNLPSGADVIGMFRGNTNLTTLDLSSWNFSPISTSTMFQDCNNLRTLDISGLDMSLCNNVSAMFSACRNLETIGNAVWDLSSVTSMWRLFSNCNKLVLDVSNWIVTSTTTDIREVFIDCHEFNSDVSSWDVSGATTSARMFRGAYSFNQPLDTWNVSNVTDMSSMFLNSKAFNQDISGWNTSNATNMKEMFAGATSFNQPISSWDVSSVTNMYRMFYGAYSFEQNLGSWNIENVTDIRDFMRDIKISTSNYDGILAGWATQNLRPNEQINLGFSSFSSSASTDRDYIINTYGWTISDGGEAIEFSTLPAGAFVFSVKTDNTYTIPTLSTHTYNYDVETSDGQVFTGITGDTTITFPSAGTYDISITGDFSRPYFYIGSYDDKFQAVKQWSSTPLVSLERSFDRCRGFHNLATNAPNLTVCTSMNATFAFAGGNYSNAFSKSLIDSLSNWNTSNITDMSYAFHYSGVNYVNLGSWDVSSVTNMQGMFEESGNFNNGGVDSLNNWNVSNVTNFTKMFRRTHKLSQYIGDWQFGVSTSFNGMFHGKQNGIDSSWGIQNWDTTNNTSLNSTFAYTNINDLDISSWNIENVTNFSSMFYTIDLTIQEYENLLVSWASQTPQLNKTFSANQSKIIPGSPAETAKNTLINTYGWTITDGGYVDNFTEPFIYSINTALPGEGNNLQYTLPKLYDSYYTAEFSDGQVISNTFGGDVVTFANTGEYDVSITGSYSIPKYNEDQGYLSVIEVKDWGSMTLRNMSELFHEYRNLRKITSLSSPTIDSSATSLYRAFKQTRSLPNINFVRNWDVSNVENFQETFDSSGIMEDVDLSSWDVSSAINMNRMFYGNTEQYKFPRYNLSNWNMPNLTNLSNFLQYNDKVEEINITGWNTPSLATIREFNRVGRKLTSIIGIEDLDTSNVTDMYRAFIDSDSLNISLASFDMQNVTELRDIFRGNNSMSVENYDATLISWASQNVRPNEQTNFGIAKYSAAGEAARNTLINTYGWTITDGGII